MDDLCQPVIILDNDRFKPKKKNKKKNQCIWVTEMTQTPVCIC